MAEYLEREVAMTTPVLPKEYRKYQTDNLDDAYEQGWFDALDNLKNAPAVSIPQWISVKDRLPDVAGMYIVTACDEWCSHGEGIWYDSVVVVAEYSGSCWNWNDNGIDCDIDYLVTHWMPLREPPKGENDG